MADKVYERLFCCECGVEVPPGESARIVPALQPGGGVGSRNARPHVWCNACYNKEQEDAEARPKPSELHGTPAFQLHQYIWSVGEGRTDAEIRAYWVAHFTLARSMAASSRAWGEKLSPLLRELTEAGKIEKRGDRRVALYAPWAKPCHEPVVGLAHDVPIHERQPGPSYDCHPIPDDYASTPPGAMPFIDRLKRVERLLERLHAKAMKKA